MEVREGWAEVTEPMKRQAPTRTALVDEARNLGMRGGVRLPLARVRCFVHPLCPHKPHFSRHVVDQPHLTIPVKWNP